jgi:ferredoxin
VADGQRAARSIEEYLRKEIRIQTLWKSEEIDHRMADDFDLNPRQKPAMIDVEQRTGISEVETLYNEEQTLKESGRCYKCNINTIFSSTKCILCGGCVDVCPESCFRLVDIRQIQLDQNLNRNMHRWAAHGMVAVVFLHMCRVFYTATYREPRGFNWVLGVVLLILTLMLSLTGYLLPWEQWPTGH